MEINPNRARAFRDRVIKALAYQMRHRNPKGALEVVEVPRFIEEAGGQDELRTLVSEICKRACAAEDVRIHPVDRKRWGLWAFLLLDTQNTVEI